MYVQMISATCVQYIVVGFMEPESEGVWHKNLWPRRAAGPLGGTINPTTTVWL